MQITAARTEGPGPARSDAGRAERSAQRLDVALLSLACFAVVVHNMSFYPLLPSIAVDLEVGVPLLGQVPATMQLMAAGLGLLVGPIADLYGHRRALFVGLSALTISSFASALAPAYAVLLLASVFSAIGRAITMPVAQAAAGVRFTGEARRRAIGWIQAGTSLAVIVGIPALTTVAAVASWRGAFAVQGLMTIAALVALRRLSPDPALPTVTSRLGAIVTAYAPLRNHLPTLGLIGAMMLGSASVMVFFAYTGAFFVERYAFDTQQVGWIFALSGVGLLIGNGLAGGRLGRAPLRPVVIVMLLVRGLCLASVLLLPLDTTVAVTVFSLTWIADGAYLVVVGTLLMQETPAGRATTMVLAGSAMSLGGAIGSSLGGLILAVGGFTAIGPAIVTLAACAGLLAWASGRR